MARCKKNVVSSPSVSLVAVLDVVRSRSECERVLEAVSFICTPRRSRLSSLCREKVLCDLLVRKVLPWELGKILLTKQISEENNMNVHQNNSF